MRVPLSTVPRSCGKWARGRWRQTLDSTPKNTYSCTWNSQQDTRMTIPS